MNNDGFSLTGAMIALGVTSIVLVASGIFTSSSYQSYLGDSLETNLDLAQTQIITDITNNTAWQNTLSNNAILSCWHSSPTCAGTETGSIEIFNAAGNVDVGAAGSSVGVAPNGSQCNNYTGAGNNTCPAQFQINIAITCPLGCANPVMTLTGTLTLDQNTQYKIINPQTFAFTEVKTLNPGSVMACATASYSQAGGVSVDPVSNTLTSAQIFGGGLSNGPIMQTYTSASSWGLQCLNGYMVVGCTATLGPSNDPGAEILDLGGNPGCFGDATNWSDTTITLTCCGSG